MVSQPSTAPEREWTSSEWQSLLRTHTDDSGRNFHHLLLTTPGASTLVVHFSAFHTAMGRDRRDRHTYQGYFHRLRMLGPTGVHNWLFLCDEYGADGDGTYYLGERGDLYVERATATILDSVLDELKLKPENVVMMGSSMGATGALKFGLRMNCLGIVAIAPHIDLDVCAEKQGRWRHVAWACPDGQPTAEHNRYLTRQIERLLADWPAGTQLPRLFLQSAGDDYGVYPDQIAPLDARWHALGGWIDLDLRQRGGHTSDWATKALLLDVVGAMFERRPVDLNLYQRLPPYLGRLTEPTPTEHVIRLLVRGRDFLFRRDSSSTH